MSAVNYDLIVMLMAAYSYHGLDTLNNNQYFTTVCSWWDNNNSNDFFVQDIVQGVAGGTSSVNLTSGNLYTKYFSAFMLSLKTS